MLVINIFSLAWSVFLWKQDQNKIEQTLGALAPIDEILEARFPPQGPEWAALQQKQAANNSQLFQMLVKSQKTILDQVMTTQALANLQLWEQVIQSLTTRKTEAANPVATSGSIFPPPTYYHAAKDD